MLINRRGEAFGRYVLCTGFANAFVKVPRFIYQMLRPDKVVSHIRSVTGEMSIYPLKAIR
jgi:hypothetical protein